VQVYPSEDDKDYHEERRSRRRRLAIQHALTGHRQEQTATAANEEVRLQSLSIGQEEEEAS
jgi:hypothetical protein